jgi:hypothetical protein
MNIRIKIVDKRLYTAGKKTRTEDGGVNFVLKNDSLVQIITQKDKARC